MMALDRPHFVAHAEVFRARAGVSDRLRLSGLWVAGSLQALDRKAVAVVGSRAPSEGGRARAHALGVALAQRGMCLVSGLALGIDAAAHEGSLAGGGATIGVLGGGHRRFFPRRNHELAERIVAGGGAVFSPYAPDQPALPAYFLQRNAVIAALADAVVVVEAAARSGALNTAGWAASLGVDVLAYPGDVDRPKAAGCNALIRDGATLVRGPDDVLDALGVPSPPLRASGTMEPSAPFERRLLGCLAAESADLDALVAATKAPVGDVVAALVSLELAGFVQRRECGVYAARGR